MKHYYDSNAASADRGPSSQASLPVLAVQAVRRQLKTYPASTLADIYKSFFQDDFGPGHLLDDPDAARSWYERELDAITSRGRHEHEPCGIGRHFCRACMDAVVDGLVDRDRFFEVFLKGAAGFRLPDPETWAAKWNLILDSIRPLRREIPGFDEDAATIASALQRGRCTMHHSSAFVAQYDPHYRIITISDADGLRERGA